MHCGTDRSHIVFDKVRKARFAYELDTFRVLGTSKRISAFCRFRSKCLDRTFSHYRFINVVEALEPLIPRKKALTLAHLLQDMCLKKLDANAGHGSLDQRLAKRGLLGA